MSRLPFIFIVLLAALLSSGASAPNAVVKNEGPVGAANRLANETDHVGANAYAYDANNNLTSLVFGKVNVASQP
jgi:hypothetical protein